MGYLYLFLVVVRNFWSTARLVKLAVECCEGEEGCQKKVKGGAVQLVLQRVSFDSYPYHRAGKYTLLYALLYM